MVFCTDPPRPFLFETMCSWDAMVFPPWSPVMIMLRYTDGDQELRHRVNVALLVSFLVVPPLLYRISWSMHPENRFTNFFLVWPVGCGVVLYAIGILYLANSFLAMLPWIVLVCGALAGIAAALVGLWRAWNRCVGRSFDDVRVAVKERFAVVNRALAPTKADDAEKEKGSFPQAENDV